MSNLSIFLKVFSFIALPLTILIVALIIFVGTLIVTAWRQLIEVTDNPDGK